MVRFPDELNSYISREFVRQRAVGWIRPADHDAPEAMLLWGTLGYALYLSADGRVWVERDWIEDQGVREASSQESAGAFLKAAERHPLFRQLVPSRPADAPPCEACAGDGSMRFTDVHGRDGAIYCPQCEGLGWHLLAAG